MTVDEALAELDIVGRNRLCGYWYELDGEMRAGIKPSFAERLVALSLVRLVSPHPDKDGWLTCALTDFGRAVRMAAWQLKESIDAVGTARVQELTEVELALRPTALEDIITLTLNQGKE